MSLSLQNVPRRFYTMSIIYDALPKTQRNREFITIQEALIQKKINHSHYFLIICTLLTVLIFGSAGFFTAFYWQKNHLYRNIKMNAMEGTKNPVDKTLQIPEHLWVTQATPPANIEPKPKSESVPMVAAAENPSVSQPVKLAEAKPVEMTNQNPQPVLPTVETKPIPQLTLNGVLISDKEKIALINNQPYKVGEEV